MERCEILKAVLFHLFMVMQNSLNSRSVNILHEVKKNIVSNSKL